MNAPTPPTPNVNIDPAGPLTALADNMPWRKLTIPIIGVIGIDFLLFSFIAVMFVAALQHNQIEQANIMLYSALGTIILNVAAVGAYLFLSVKHWRLFLIDVRQQQNQNMPRV